MTGCADHWRPMAAFTAALQLPPRTQAAPNRTRAPVHVARLRAIKQLSLLLSDAHALIHDRLETVLCSDPAIRFSIRQLARANFEA